MFAVQTSGVDDLTTTTVPSPEPGPGEVRITVAGAGVNPVDAGTRSGVFHEAGFIGAGSTVGVGWDVSGVVDAVGDGVDLAVGAAVAGLRTDLTTEFGAYADTIVLPADAVATIAEGIGFIEAAALPLNILTAAQALDLAGDPGRILITGAAGAVGGFAASDAASRGWTVTALARETDREFLDAAGAHAVITELGGEQFDAVLDAAVLGALDSVCDGGVYVGVIPAAVPTTDRDVTVKVVSVTADGARLATLLQRVADGSVANRVAGRLPLTEARAAQDRSAASGVRGRWLLVP